MFIVYKKGVYIRDICSVHLSSAKACDAANHYAFHDVDNHHTWGIIERLVDVLALIDHKRDSDINVLTPLYTTDHNEQVKET